MSTDLDKKKMLRETMLAKVEDVLKSGKKDASPAYTLILGAGASFGVVPTAKEMLGFPDAKTKKVHEKSVPVWLAKQLDPDAKFDHDTARLECSKAFWKKFLADNAGNNKCNGIEIGGEGLPTTTSIAAAYQSVFDTACIGGLDTPERHQSFMRAVTMSADAGSTLLNATHFYLASLLSLQKRPGELGSDKKPLYTGRREFARTIFTTNFDPLLQTSLQLFQLLYYMTDRPEFLSADALQTDHHPAVHLFYAHGSVHRPYMANTDEQIALLKQQNARDLAAYLGNHGVIVLGYSGWDDCLLEALNQTKTFSNNLYWLARSADSISEGVAKFLATHPNAYWVEIDDGGSFMAELHSRLCPGAPNTEMLYNPIRPLLCQLGCVNLAGIQGGGLEKDKDAENDVSAPDVPRDVEAIRQQVIARLEDAQKLFTEPSKAGADLAELERQADLSYANKDWETALAAYDRLLNQEPGLPLQRKALALFRRGACHGRNGETDKAIAGQTAVIEMPGAPSDLVAKARIQRGFYHGKKREKEKEIADYTAVVEMTGVPVAIAAMARVNRGICHGNTADKDKAIADYTAVIEMTQAPVDQVSKARLNRGVCYGEKRETDKEMADYTAVIELAGAPVELVAKARYNRGLRHGLKGETEKAIIDYTAVIEMTRTPVAEAAMARINRGLLHSQKGETEKAMADYTAVIEMTGAPAARVTRAKELLATLKKSANS